METGNKVFVLENRPRTVTVGKLLPRMIARTGEYMIELENGKVLFRTPDQFTEFITKAINHIRKDG